MAEEILLKEPYVDERESDDEQPPAYTSQPKIKSSKVKFMPLANENVKADPPMGAIYFGLIMMIFCIWPCGLIGVIFGLQAMQSHYRGELHQTKRLNTLSKRFSIASLVIGIVLWGIVCLVLALEAYTVIRFIHKAKSEYQDPTPAF